VLLKVDKSDLRDALQDELEVCANPLP